MLAMMTADTVSGVWPWALELARGLGACGVDVALATMGAPPTAEQRAAALSIPTLELYPSSVRLEWMPEPWADVTRAGDWLLELAARLRPDVVHLNGYAHGALPWPAPVLVVAHSCVLSWWRAVHGAPAPPAWERYRRAVAAGLAGAEVVVAPTAAMLAALRSHYRVPFQGRVIANGRHADDFAPGDKQPYVFAVGRLWDEARNLRALDHAARALAWPVCVAGDARAPGGLPAAPRPQHLHLLGPLDRTTLAEWLAHAGIYALPARYEPFGLSVLEAGLAGCALVLGDIPSMRETWGGAARFVPPDDPPALRDALAELVVDERRREQMGGRARRRARVFTAGAMAARYLALYRELAGGRARVRCAS